MIGSTARDTFPDPALQPFETLADLVASFAGRGQRTAVVAFGRAGVTESSYAELAAAIARTAQGLRDHGIARGDRVALWAPNGAEWIVAYFGIVTAGAAAVCLDHQSTADGAAAALALATPRLLVTTLAHHRELERALPSPPAALLLDGEGPQSFGALRAVREPTALPVLSGEHLASLLFTSGTTGTPKAVPLTHANLVANTRELLAAELIDADDRVLLPLPLHHTYPFTVGLLTGLATGATLVLPAGISGPEIVQACAEGRATALLAVPRLCTAIWDSVTAAVRARGTAALVLFRTLLAASSAVRRLTGLRIGKRLFAAVHARLGGDLDLIGCGGAKLPAELARNLEALGWTVLTGYGLTETSPVLTFNSPRHSRLGSEGCALTGVELRIAGADSDTPGEILARGPSVFAGYWHNPSATAAAFTPDGWFRTGDLGRLDAHGYLYVVGRSKELIVLADGKKIFPEDVEKLYAGCALLREVGVFEHDGMLAAVVVPDDDAVRAHGALREAASLREALEDVASRLPPYQRVTSYRVVRAPLPRTHLGKLRRHLLPALFAGAALEPAAAAAPLEAADRALVETPLGSSVWRWLAERFPNHALTLDTSPQLDLAIDSLEWLSLTTEIERRFGVALLSDQLSRILTLRDLLREIESAERTVPQRAPPPPAFVPPGPVLRALGAAVYAVLRVVVRVALRLSVSGTERLPAGPVLITPNHTSYLDPLVVAAALPWSHLRRTYWAGWVGVLHSSPLRRLLSRATQVFPVDPEHDLATGVRTARDLLARGYSVVWFPEGRRSPTGRLGEFQAGVGLVLAGTGVAAVPTAIDGTFAAWPKHRRWPRLARASVAFGTPLEPVAVGDRTETVKLLEQAVGALLGESRAAAERPLRTQDRRGDPAMPTPTTEASTVTLRDGRRVTLRPVRRDDVARTAAFLDELSPPSKHFLFLGGITRLSDTALRRLCDPDYAHDMAYVAVTANTAAGESERQVGVCRYAGADSQRGAEISVAVADDWQHQGLGKLLLSRLIEHARSHGVHRLYSIDAATNEPMRRLARELGFREEPDPDDIHQVVYSLQPQRS